MTGADLLVEELSARGVSYVATLNGHGLDPFLIACRRAQMRVIDVRNEQAAGYMAEVTGRLSRSVGVCAVSGGVAHANALTGVVNAWFDGAPMLLITGITPLADLDRGQFQDFNHVPMADPVCKYARLVDVPQNVPQITHEAFVAATTGRPGPVHLALPMDVASAQVDPASVSRSPVRSGRVSGGISAPDTVLIQEAAQLLGDAKRPLLVAGSGCYYAQGEEPLAEFVRQQHVPTVVPIWDRGAIRQPLKAFMGVIGAASGGPKLLEDADLILLIGADLDYRVGHASPPAVSEQARIVRIDADAARLRSDRQFDLCIEGSPRLAFESLSNACRDLACKPATAWLKEAVRRRDEHRRRCEALADALPAGMNGRDVVRAIEKVLDDDTILLVDGGNIGQWFHQLLAVKYPGHWLTCGASGVVGWGMPGAMAARALHPDKPIVLLSGDGSFTFTLSELECAARQGLPFVAVVADDRQWGISVTGHVAAFGEPLYSLLGETRLDLVAKGLGCDGVRVEAPDQLAGALKEALASPRPTVIHVPIVPGSPK